MRRRALLRAAAAAGVAGLAGCTSTGPSDDGPAGAGGGGSPTDSPTDAPTDTPGETAEPTTGPTKTERPDEQKTGAQSPEGTPADDGTPTHTPQGALQRQSFELTDRGCGTGEDTVDIAFEDHTVVLDGTIGGSSGCYVAEQDDLTYDEAADHLSVNVRSYQPDDAETCTDCLVDIEYEARYEFDGSAPGEVAVSHNGRGIAAAAHGSSSASPE